MLFQLHSGAENVDFEPNIFAEVFVWYRGAPRIFSRGGPEQIFSYIVTNRVANITLT